jgi:hypothetical protein
MLEDDRASRAEEDSGPTLRELAMVLFRQRRILIGISSSIFIDPNCGCWFVEDVPILQSPRSKTLLLISLAPK